MALDFTEPFTERTARIVHAAKLHKAKERHKAGKFIIEGENAVDAAVSTGAATDVFVTEAAAQRFDYILTAAGYMGVFVHPITEGAAKYLSDTITTTGLFALCRPVLWSAGKILAGSPRLVSVPVLTSEPGNAGTLIRTSDAMGADGVIFAGETVDPLGCKVARASAGSLFHVPVARERNIADVIGQLRKAGMQILASAADGEVDVADADLSQPTAWLFGNEAHGLGALLEEADVRVRIPILGRAESLNLATAASICLYESARALNSHP
ncbi:TrmH family RNA methyltransferase [Corynebacterium liangguodongii]|uniref:RNA methyltransferase n=1 Tax=Corynebacterium liangguodongii TaxID=2079535 RepID=A0A2S0WDU4_9CORY|nr:RNA methyltransferase [Corynebacterium liangguodongii]AWB83948.1 RNA methyltransferase [Corynebacterium liangguodongii]PWB99087.1 RNA methyltransferase [Corynebacterium liangguodongii]